MSLSDRKYIISREIYSGFLFNLQHEQHSSMRKILRTVLFVSDKLLLGALLCRVTLLLTFK